MRQGRYDRIKSQQQIAKDFEKFCKVCEENGEQVPLTQYSGPGSDCLCRMHQLSMRDYGGYGRLHKTHTFHRRDVCTCCGNDINEDPRWEKAEAFFGITLTDLQRNEVKRRYNHGDHKDRKADGGANNEENITAFCSFCHWVKTVIFNDGRKPQ